eukprot:c40736_g1_i1 orf=1-216(-)
MFFLLYFYCFVHKTGLGISDEDACDSVYPFHNHCMCLIQDFCITRDLTGSVCMHGFMYPYINSEHAKGHGQN